MKMLRFSVLLLLTGCHHNVELHHINRVLVVGIGRNVTWVTITPESYCDALTSKVKGLPPMSPEQVEFCKEVKKK